MVGVRYCKVGLGNDGAARNIPLALQLVQSNFMRQLIAAFCGRGEIGNGLIVFSFGRDNHITRVPSHQAVRTIGCSGRLG